MLSGLPITYQVPVRAILVSEHPRATLGTATCDYPSKYIPRTFPIRGTYDDYGRLENVPDDVFKRLWVKGLQTDLIELLEGENRCHDIAVFRDMDFDKLWEAIWEERLLVPGLGTSIEESDKSPGPVALEAVDQAISRFGIRNVRVQVALIREDVWQASMATPFEPSPYYKLPDSLDKLRWAVRGYWDECSSLLSGAVRFDPSTQLSTMTETLLLGRDISSVRNTIRKSTRALKPIENPLGDMIRDECVFGLGSHWLMALEGEVKPEELDAFYFGVAEMIWFEWVNSYRARGSLWKPSYAGGQNQPWKRHLKFHKDMVGILEGLITRHEAEYGKDGEEDEP
jgi:hypothetical protein